MAENSSETAAKSAKPAKSAKSEKSEKSETAPTTTQGESVFADDDLGRIQGILFGDHARKTDERLNVMEIALLGAIADLREETAAKFEALDARLDAESETRDRAVGNLSSRLGRDVTDQSKRLTDLRSEVESMEDGFTKSVGAIESTVDSAIGQLRSDTQQSIDETRTSIGKKKIDRSELSRILRELGEQLDLEEPSRGWGCPSRRRA